MKSRKKLSRCLFALLFCFAAPVLGANQTNQASQEGKLVVLVWLGDNNTPSRDAFVYVQGNLGSPSMALSAKSTGRFEISLRPGLYDVFVSEGSSLPMCKRIEIKPNFTKFYKAKMEVDEEHLEN